jgi:hypothetical protein
MWKKILLGIVSAATLSIATPAFARTEHGRLRYDSRREATEHYLRWHRWRRQREAREWRESHRHSPRYYDGHRW